MSTLASMIAAPRALVQCDGQTANGYGLAYGRDRCRLISTESARLHPTAAKGRLVSLCPESCGDARIQGSYGTYRTWVRSGSRGLDSGCTCPSDWRPCKHVAALDCT